MLTSNESLLALVLARTLVRAAKAVSTDSASALEQFRADAHEDLQDISAEIFSTDNRELAVEALERLFRMAKDELHPRQSKRDFRVVGQRDDLAL